MTLKFIVNGCMSRLARRGLTAKCKLFIYEINIRQHSAFARNKNTCNYDKLLIRQNVVVKDEVCRIHLSPPRNALPPLLVLALRSLAKIGAIISGRIIRQWWRKLSPEEKEEVLRSIHSKKSKIAFTGTFLIGALYLYYLSNMTEDPITKRKRFIMLNKKQLQDIADFEYLQQLNQFKAFVVPQWHPVYRRVNRVANNLLLANRNLAEIRDKVWSVTVVDKPEITNAFALPNGKIFVFTGMLNICTNDDQLAIVLAHEISHSILSHAAESMSKMFLLEFVLLVPTVVLFSILSDAGAFVADWIISSVAKVLIHLPFSRAIESEADVVGLHLAAKACYDIREAPVFWGKMKILGRDAPVEWLSTHPRHENRQQELQELLPDALKLREASNCPPLAPKFHIFH